MMEEIRLPACVHKGRSLMQALLFLPEGVTEASGAGEYPLLVYLHGAGERGTDITLLYRHAVPMFIHQGQEWPALVLVPQCPAPYVWNNVVRELKGLIDQVAERYCVKADRIALTGSSMGGFGTWEMAMTYPSYFSAVGPVAGGGMSWRCANLRTTPVIAVHGTADIAVPLVYSQMMVASAQARGVEAELIEIPGAGHNDGIDRAYAETPLLTRLLEARRTDFTPVPECMVGLCPRD